MQIDYITIFTLTHFLCTTLIKLTYNYNGFSQPPMQQHVTCSNACVYIHKQVCLESKAVHKCTRNKLDSIN